MEDLKRIFDKVEKAEAILADLDKKRDVKAIEKDDYDKLSREYHSTLDHARKAMSFIKDKLARELTSKTAELTKYREELALLDTRSKVGEIIEETYQSKSKGLAEKIKGLVMKIAELQSMVDTQFADDVPIIKDNAAIGKELGAAKESAPVAPVPEPTQEPQPPVTSPVGLVTAEQPEKPLEITVAAAATEPVIPVEPALTTAETEPIPAETASSSMPAEEKPQPQPDEKIPADSGFRRGIPFCGYRPYSRACGGRAS